MRSDTIHTEILTPESFQVSIIDASKFNNIVACVNSDNDIDFLLITLVKEFYSNNGRSKVIIVEEDEIDDKLSVLSTHTNLACSALPVACGRGDAQPLVDVYVLSSKQMLYALKVKLLRLANLDYNVDLVIFTNCDNVLENNGAVEIIMSVCMNSPHKKDIRVIAITSKLMKEIKTSKDLQRKLSSLAHIYKANIEICRDMIQSDIYGTKPEVVEVSYTADSHHMAKVYKRVKTILQPTVNFLQKNISEGEVDTKNYMKTLQVINECIRILDTLGVWCAGKVAESMSNRVYREAALFAKDTHDNFLYEMIGCVLTQVHSVTNEYFNKEVLTIEDFHKIISSRALKLLKICKEYKPTNDFVIPTDPRYIKATLSESDTQINVDPRRDASEAPALCGIVFVQHRHTAQMLSKLVEQVAIFDEDLFHVNSKHLHGGRGLDNNKRREVTLNQFRQRQINLLFVTSDFNEKLDLPRCNLVIQFDPPTTPISYIQSKGCARVQNSKLYSLISNNDVEVKFSIHEFKNIENILTQKTFQYFNMDLEPASSYNEPFLLDEGSGSQLHLHQAISVINRYCQRLPSDTFTHLTATAQYLEVTNNKFVASIRLPMNSAIKRPVKGKVCGSRLDALRSSALKICSKLHEMKELDENFCPNGKDVIKYEDIDNEWLDFEQIGGAKPGSTTRKVYPKKMAKALIQNIDYTVFLYEIHIKLEEEATDAQNSRNRKTFEPQNYNRSFGIISNKKLPPIPVFPLFIRSGEVSVEIREVYSSLELNDVEICNLNEFHRFIFKSVLKLEKKSVNFSPLNALSSFLITPTIIVDNNLNIDWQFIKKVESYKNSDDRITAISYTSLPANDDQSSFIFDESVFSDAVVTPSYRNTENPQFFYVAEIRDDLTPMSEFPTKDSHAVGISYRTFADYYITKYSTKITDYKQPLIDVDHTNARLNLLTPRYLTQKLNSGDPGDTVPPPRKPRLIRDDQKQLFVPELCRVHVMPASLWRKAICIPAVLYRLNSLLVAGELRERIGCKAGAGCKRLPVDFRFERMKLIFPENNKNIENGTNFTFKHENDDNVDTFLGPSTFNILQALTMSCSNDFFNLERLETIGDSFLKFAITLHLYEENAMTHEGRLSYMRSKHVSNYNLYAKGKDKRFAEYMISSKFEPGENWLPPCYKAVEINCSYSDSMVSSDNGEIEPLRKPATLTVPQTQHCIADKSIADCVESLIGCYLINGGEKAAVRFINWVLNLKKTKIDKSLEDQDISPHLLIGFSEFEKIIQYKFNDKNKLLQALTHASYKYNSNTDCYQRLEFLGDAVIDYMITRHVFEDKAMHNPGILTDMRSALVNNNLFACLSVKWNFHKFMKSLSASQFKVVDIFISNKYSDPDIIKETDHNYADSVENEIEHPKALADLFEALAGAIYLDCDKDLDVVWKVYRRLMQPQLDAIAKKIPMSPVRELLELEPETVKFEKPERMEDGRIRVTVKVIDKDSYQGIGRNYKIAKCAAAMQALKYIKVGNLKAAALQMNTNAIHNAMFK